MTANKVVLQTLKKTLTAEKEESLMLVDWIIKNEDPRTVLLYRNMLHDSLRHQDILTFLASFLAHDETESAAPKESKKDLEDQVKKEEASRKHCETVVPHVKDTMMRLMLQSIIQDEHKHTSMLRYLLRSKKS